MGVNISNPDVDSDPDTSSWAAVTRASGFDAFVTTPTSANLAALITDETGTGSLVFASAPTFARITNQTSGLSWASGPVSTIQSAGTIGTHTLSGSGVAAYHTFNLNGDNVDTGAYNGLFNVYAGMVVGGANAKGHRTAAAGVVVVSSTTGNTSNYFYTGGECRAIAQANDNGTALDPNGTIVGGFDSASLYSSATYWSGLIGREIDVEARAGAAPLWKTGLQIIQRFTDVESGTQADEALVIANQNGGTAPGWNIGFSFGTPHGVWPIKSTGTMIGTQSTALVGPTYEAAYGVDFNAVTFSTAAFRSNGFLVSPSGVITGTLTNCTGLPISTGVAGLGSGWSGILAATPPRPVSATVYGFVVGGGNADAATNTAALQAALNANYWVQLPEGTAYINKITHTRTNRLSGLGQGVSILVRANNLNDYALYSSAKDDMIYEDFTLDQNRANNTGSGSHDGIRMQGGPNRWRLRRLKVTGARGTFSGSPVGAGFASVGGGSRGIIDQCWFDDCYDGYVLSAHTDARDFGSRMTTCTRNGGLVSGSSHRFEHHGVEATGNCTTYGGAGLQIINSNDAKGYGGTFNSNTLGHGLQHNNSDRCETHGGTYNSNGISGLDFFNSVDAKVFGGYATLNAVRGLEVDSASNGAIVTGFQGVSNTDVDISVFRSADVQLIGCEGNVRGWDAAVIATATVSAGGTGYSVNDVLTVSGGTKATAATLTVATVGGGGAITSVTVTNGGNYWTFPSEPAAVTGGTGTGATFTFTATAEASSTVARLQVIGGHRSDTILLANNACTDVRLTNVKATTITDESGEIVSALGCASIDTSPVRTLESFGAVGDGVADDTAAIRLAAASGVVVTGTPGAIYLMHTEGVSQSHWTGPTLFLRCHFRAKTGTGAFNSKYQGGAYRNLITQNMFILTNYDGGGGFEDCTFDTDGAAEVCVTAVRVSDGCDTKPFVMKGVNKFSGFTGISGVAVLQSAGKAGIHCDTLQFEDIGSTRSVAEGYWLDGTFAQVTVLAIDNDLAVHGSYNLHIKTVILDNIFSSGEHFAEGPQLDGVTIVCPSDLSKLTDRRIRIDRILAREVVGEVYDFQGTGVWCGEVWAENCMVPGKHIHGSDAIVGAIYAKRSGYLSLGPSTTTALPTKPKIGMYKAMETGYIIRTATAQAGGASTITLDSGASSINDYYVTNGGARVWITSGTGSGQSREISSYDGSTKVLTVSSAWSTNPDNTSVFVITNSANAAAVIFFTDDGTGTYVGPMSGAELAIDVEDSSYITNKIHSAVTGTNRYNLVRIVEPRGRTTNVASRTASIQIVHATYPDGLELYRNTAALTLTGTTSLTTMETVTVPANAMGRNGEVIIEGLVSWTESANNKTFRVNFGGTNIMEVFGGTGILEHVPFRLRVRNLASLSVQRSSNVAYPYTVTSNPIRSLTVDTSNSTTVTITAQLANSGETITVSDLVVRVVHAP